MGNAKTSCSAYKKVTVPNDKIKKVKYSKTTAEGKEQVRYAFRAVDDDGVNLTKFASKDNWEAVNAPIE